MKGQKEIFCQPTTAIFDRDPQADDHCFKAFCRNTASGYWLVPPVCFRNLQISGCVR